MGFLRQLKRDDGIALLMAIGMLFVLSIAGTTVLVYTTANARSVTLSKTNTASFSLAEAAEARVEHDHVPRLALDDVARHLVRVHSVQHAELALRDQVFHAPPPGTADGSVLAASLRSA
jgi:hypothetical protein